MTFGKRLKELRKEKEWSQFDMAIECDCSGSDISKLERGIKNPSFSMSRRIARGLGMTLAELFEGVE